MSKSPEELQKEAIRAYTLNLLFQLGGISSEKLQSACEVLFNLECNVLQISPPDTFFSTHETTAFNVLDTVLELVKAEYHTEVAVYDNGHTYAVEKLDQENNGEGRNIFFICI